MKTKALLLTLLLLPLAAQTQAPIEKPDVYIRVHQAKWWYEPPWATSHLEVAYYWLDHPGDGFKWEMTYTTNGVNWMAPPTTGTVAAHQWASLRLDTVRTPGFRWDLVARPE